MDSRCDIKISFSIYGMNFKQEWNINYSPRDCKVGMDRRIEEWFQNCYDEAHEEFEYRMMESRREETERQKERQEREMLNYLKAKYEPPNIDI